MFSVDAPGIPDVELEPIIAQTDVFNLHWCARFLSVRNIERMSRSGKPVVLTIRDMNLLTGGCHFFHGCENWMRDCLPCPQFTPQHLHLPNATLDAKRTLWDLTNITVVVLSDHTHDLIKRSPLLKNCRVEKIPNPLDVSVFRPRDRERCRAEFGVPLGKNVIAYLPSFRSSVKGTAEAKEALLKLSLMMPVEKCALVTAGSLGFPLDVPFETINAGFIGDRRRLARFYASADVTLIPSTEETFSNTAAESVACGTPVVGFQVGAVPEISQGVRGCAVPVGDTEALATALNEILSREPASPSTLHAYVAEIFDTRKVGSRYLQLFKDLRTRTHTTSPACLYPAGNARREAASDRLDWLLREYRKVRSMETFTYAARLFFFDNRAFWTRVWSLVAKR